MPAGTVSSAFINFNDARDISDCLGREDEHLQPSELLGVRVLAKMYGMRSTARFRDAVGACGLRLPARACDLQHVLALWRSQFPGEAISSLSQR